MSHEVIENLTFEECPNDISYNLQKQVLVIKFQRKVVKTLRFSVKYFQHRNCYYSALQF